MNQINYAYFEWLTSQIHTPTNGKTYGELFSRMHNLEFVWIVPNDDNRVQDGLDLRAEFLHGTRRRLALNGVSMLEILVSLSRRVAFTAGGDAEQWAWRLIKNLHLHKASDPLSDTMSKRIDETLYALVWRTYQPNGQGGFFPLKYTDQDQTKVEIWYQMNAYVNEMEV